MEVVGQTVAQALVQDSAVQAHAPARLAHVVRGHPRPGHVQWQLHDPLGRAVQLVQRRRQPEPELLPVQREVPVLLTHHVECVATLEPTAKTAKCS